MCSQINVKLILLMEILKAPVVFMYSVFYVGLNVFLFSYQSELQFDSFMFFIDNKKNRFAN